MAETTTRTRKSRAARAADQAAQDRPDDSPTETDSPAGDPTGTEADDEREAEDDDELCPHDLDPSTCAECNGTAAAEREAEAKPEQPKADTDPFATVTSTEVAMPYFRGQVQVRVPGPDGTAETVETLTCECQWAHTTPEIAAKCGRKLAAGRGLKVKAAE
jgi:hypothetical protein